MIEPVLKDEAFLEDIASVDLDDRRLCLWWLGQSGFLVQHSGQRLLFDPYLSDSLTNKYQNTIKPHVRMSCRVVAPEHLLVGALFSTHNHTDHLDSETLRPLMRSSGGRLFVSAANVEEAYRRAQVGFGIIGLTEEVDHSESGGWFRVRIVPAAHEVIERDERGFLKCVGFVVTLGPWTIYHSGDTLVYDGIVERLRPFNVDVAILPINGKVGNMNGADAARLAKEIRARLVIPCHYDMFEFNTADPADEFIPECERIGQKYRVLQQGERWSSDELT